jgi:hypothetical protein
MKRTACILAVAALALGGCKKEAQSDEAAATAQTAQQIPAATAPAEPAVEEQIPTEEDFEEEALEEINSGNLEEELDKLEKEIKGDTE